MSGQSSLDDLGILQSPGSAEFKGQTQHLMIRSVGEPHRSMIFISQRSTAIPFFSAWGSGKRLVLA